MQICISRKMLKGRVAATQTPPTVALALSLPKKMYMKGKRFE